MRNPLHTSFLIVSLCVSGALAAACGPATPEPVNPTPTATPTSEPAPTATPSASPTAATPPPSATPSATPTAPPASTVQNQPIQPSAMIDDVKKIGFDMKKVPTLESLPMAQKKKVMPFFVKALGYQNCGGCHVEGDFKKETHNIKLARQMWDHFIVQERDAKGGNIFCDSCHNGKQKLLDRSNKDALKKFMESDYVGKLTRADKKDQECATCHTDTFEMKIFEKVWGIPPG